MRSEAQKIQRYKQHSMKILKIVKECFDDICSCRLVIIFTYNCFIFCSRK